MIFELKKVHFKLCPGNPLSHHVHIIRKKTRPTVYFTAPVGKSDTDCPNALIAISNPLVAKCILQDLGEDIYELDEVPLFIPRHISEVMSIPLSTIITTYCDISTKQQIWNIHHYTGQSLSTQLFRQHMVTPVDFE
jgi:hypothetical protein